jgi:hypothetical protein
MKTEVISADPSENVLDFKSRIQAIVNVPVELMTLIYKRKVREDTQCISEEPFTPCVEDRCFIHIRVEDPEVQERVKQLLARGLDSFIIPLDKVIVA